MVERDILGLDCRNFREAKHGVEKSGVTNLIKISISSNLLCLQVLHTKAYFIADKSKMTKLKFSDIYINKYIYKSDGVCIYLHIQHKFHFDLITYVRVYTNTHKYVYRGVCVHIYIYISTHTHTL